MRYRMFTAVLVGLFVWFAVHPDISRAASEVPANHYNHQPVTEKGPLNKASGRVLALAFNRDATLIARGDFGNHLGVFNTADGSLVWEKKGKQILPTSLVDVWPLDLVLSAQGEFDGAKINGFKWKSGEPQGRFAPYGGGRNALAFHSTLAEIAWVGAQGELYRFYILNSKFRAKGTRQHDRSPYGLAYSGSGDVLYSASPDKKAVAWNTKTGEAKLLFTANYPLIDVAAPRQRDSDRVVFGENRGLLTVIDTKSGKPVKTLQVPDKGVSNLDFHPKNSDLMIVAGKTHVYFWQLSSGRILRTIDTGDRIFALAISQDGTKIATGHESGKVSLLIGK